MWRRKVEEKIDFNYMIQNKKAFRNPSIYEKLIVHMKIDELGRYTSMCSVQCAVQRAVSCLQCAVCRVWCIFLVCSVVLSFNHPVF